MNIQAGENIEIELIDNNTIKINSIIPNKNLLLNWYFKDPLNSLFHTEMEGNYYFFDCWRSNGRGLVKLTPEGFTQARGNSLMQKLSTRYIIPDKPMTVSALLNDGTLVTYTTTFTQENLEGTNIVYHRYEYPELGGEINYVPPSGDYLTGYLQISFWSNYREIDTYYIEAVKLEYGEHSTLAREVDGKYELLDNIPNKAEEELRCGEYIFSNTQNSSTLNQLYLGIFKATETWAAYGHITSPVTLNPDFKPLPAIYEPSTYPTQGIKAVAHCSVWDVSSGTKVQKNYVQLEGTVSIYSSVGKDIILKILIDSKNYSNYSGLVGEVPVIALMKNTQGYIITKYF